MAKIKVLSDDKAEKADYMVCPLWGSPSPFFDNRKGTCCECGCDVMFRWHAARKPKRICTACMARKLVRTGS